MANDSDDLKPDPCGAGDPRGRYVAIFGPIHSSPLGLSPQVVLADPDADGTPAEDGADADAAAAAAAKPPAFDQIAFPPGPGEWRCRSCYATRFKTFCFGVNPAPPPAGLAAGLAAGLGESAAAAGLAAGLGESAAAAAVACTHCGKPRSEAGWSVWLPYGALPGGWRATVQRRYGPPLAALLKSKWPTAAVSLAPGEPGDLPPI